MRRLFYALSTVCLASCNQQVEEPPASAVDEAAATPPVPTAPLLSGADLVRVCKGGIAFRNNRPVEGIDASNREGTVRLTYTRPDDGKFFAYDCRVDAAQVRYRMIDEAGPGSGPGVWSGRGSTTTFEIKPDGVVYKDVFNDGSEVSKKIDI